MPLSSVSYVASCGWSQVNGTNTGFNPASESDSMSFTLGGVSIATWNQLFADYVTLAPSASVDLDLTSVSNLVCETFAFAHVLAIMVQPSGADITLGPGASNGLQWFFGSTSDTIQIDNGGVMMWSNGVSATGDVVNGTHKILTLTNLSGVNTAIIKLSILGRTT